jgi:hypothetical protein
MTEVPIRTDVPAQPSDSGRPAARPAAHPAPRRPDPTAARLAVAAGGIASISALLSAIAGAAIPSTTSAAAPTAITQAAPAAQTVVRYVYVQSGQATPAPQLATVVPPPAPAPQPAPVVTRQSGVKP